MQTRKSISDRISSTTVFSQTQEKIESFRSITKGWHFGEGVPARIETVKIAQLINTAACVSGFCNTDAFLGLDGEIRITVYQDKFYFEFTVEINQLITFVYEVDGREIDCYDNLDFDSTNKIIRNKLSKIISILNNRDTTSEVYDAGKIENAEWNTSVCYIKITTTDSWVDSKILSLKTQATGQEFPFLEKAAP